jgi:hypothetical protein
MYLYVCSLFSQYYAYLDPSVLRIVILLDLISSLVSLRSTHVEATLGLQQCMLALKDMEVRIWLNVSDDSSNDNLYMTDHMAERLPRLGASKRGQVVRWYICSAAAANTRAAIRKTKTASRRCIRPRKESGISSKQCLRAGEW